MELKKIGPAQIDALWDLQKQYKSAVGEEEPTDADKDRLAAAIGRGAIFFYGAFEDDRLIGCCSVTVGFSTFDYLPGGVFEDFYILPEYRHKGIARQLVQHDMDVTALGVPRGQILGSDIRYIPTSDDIRDELFSSIMLLNAEKAFGDREVKALQGTIASGDQFISSKGKKQLIVEEFEAIACEMEGAAIAQVCYVNKLPFCVLRAISDSADAGAKMDYPAFVELAASNSAKVIKRFLKNRS